MLQKEAKNLLQYYNYREIVISAKLAELSSHDDQFHKGSVAMLKHLQRINRIYYNQAEKTCQSIQNNVATNWSEYCDSDLSDDESDNDFSKSLQCIHYIHYYFVDFAQSFFKLLFA